MGAGAAQAGPIALMGIDAEDGGVGGHGPIAVYESVVSDVIADADIAGSGILVIGGGKNPGDQVTAFWNAVDTGTPGTVTYVNGAGPIAAQSFTGFKMIAVVSSVVQTLGGGLTQAEQTALVGRQSDIANFVNAGGGLMGLSQEGLTPAYGYLPNANQFTFNFPPQFSNVTSTPEGNLVGITDTNLDLCCWHDEYLTFPAFLKVLARNAASGNAVALGGEDVVVPTDVTVTPGVDTNPVGTSHTVTAKITKEGVPQPNVLVTFTVTGANAGATGTCVPANCRTDADGNVSFTYVGTNAGTDTITASFVDAQGMTVRGTATKHWIAARIAINDTSVVEGNAGFVNATFKVTLNQAVGVPVTVKYATANGTAIAPGDYVANSGTVTFVAGDTSEDVVVQVRGDLVNEADETFTVNLTMPTGAVIADPTGVGTIIDDERDGAFSCRASALRLVGLLEPVVANPPDSPCRDDSASLLRSVLSLLGVVTSADVLNARTDQTPNDLSSSPPAIGDKAIAHADTALATIGVGISATATEADAKAECTGSGVPALTSSSKVVGLKVNGQSYPVLTQPVTIPLVLATLKINHTINSPGKTIRRAVWLDNVALPDAIIGEAIANYSGNPCTT